MTHNFHGNKVSKIGAKKNEVKCILWINFLIMDCYVFDEQKKK